MDDHTTRFGNAMQLAALGDALAYQWEFVKQTIVVREKYLPTSENDRRCYKKLMPKSVNGQNFVSDDTVMHLATVEAVLSTSIFKLFGKTIHLDEENFRRAIFENYVACLDDKVMENRAPGAQSKKAVEYMEASIYPPYSPSAGGNGAAMRTMCLGLVLPHYWQRNMLVATSVIASAATHNHPTAILGGVMSAVFTSYAYKLGWERIKDWPSLFFGESLIRFAGKHRQQAQEIRQYLLKKITATPALNDLNIFELTLRECYQTKGVGDMWPIWDVNSTDDTLLYFLFKWLDYIASKGAPDYEKNVGTWDNYWSEMAFENGPDTWPGSSGHDAPMMAYDALVQIYHKHKYASLSEKLSFKFWFEVQIPAAYHGGDSDSTATIAGAWLGAMSDILAFSLQKIIDKNEFGDQLAQIPKSLRLLSTRLENV